MGIEGILPELKRITHWEHISKYAGHKVAIDAYSWLHKSACSCSRELCEGTHTDRYLMNCMKQIDLLLFWDVIPVLVFDGDKLPMKQEEESAREKKREENLEKAQKLAREGNYEDANKHFQRAKDITPAVAKFFIEALKAENVEFIVAPYEADPQMAFLAITGYVRAVIADDSDMLPYGCPTVFFQMTTAGYGKEICMNEEELHRVPSFARFSSQMFLETCILAGCDYLKSLPGIRLKRARQRMHEDRTFVQVCRRLRRANASVPDGYEAAFQRAIWTFKHQRVFDPALGRVVHLRPLPEGGLLRTARVPGALPEDDPELKDPELKFLGPLIADDIAAGIARGDLDPITRTPLGLTAEQRAVIMRRPWL